MMHTTTFRERLFETFLFFSLIGLAGCFTSCNYIISYTFPKDIFASIYTVICYISHVTALSMVLYLLFFVVLSIVITNRSTLRFIQSAAASLFISLLLMDSLMFAQHRYHLNLLTIRIVGMSSYFFFILYVLISFYCTFKFSGMISALKKKPWIKSFSYVFIGMVIVGQSFTHGTHAWADAIGYSSITRYNPYLPLFYPTTAARFFEKYGLVTKDQRENASLMKAISGGDLLKYPLSPLVFDSISHPYHVVFVVVDALRQDMCTPHRMPETCRWAEENALTYTNHFSGGNSTKIGLFSLFYALPPDCFQYIYSKKQPSLFMERVKDLYEVGIFTSDNLEHPALLHRTAFSTFNIDRIGSNALNNRTYSRDSILLEDWKKWLANNHQKPLFSFLFFAAPAASDYPQKNTKQENESDISKDSLDRYHYIRSVGFIDSLFTEVRRILSLSMNPDSTILILTADHGEEFNESGQNISGHGSAFSYTQLKVPFLVSWPGKSKGSVVTRTSHLDVSATFLSSLLGCRNPILDYSLGKSFFEPKSWSYLEVGSYFNTAILDSSSIVVQYPGGYFEVRDTNYQVKENRLLNTSMIREVFQRKRLFLQ